jgi:2-iminobutanoate/2-iminopropanoate deaminase
MILDADLLNELAKAPVEKRAVTNHRVLNEAFDYAKPSSFSRGMRIDLNGLAILLISGTASLDEHGRSLHIGDFRAQTRRTFQNIAGLLEAEGATRSRNSTHCRLRRESRPFSAGPSCW